MGEAITPSLSGFVGRSEGGFLSALLEATRDFNERTSSETEPRWKVNNFFQDHPPFKAGSRGRTVLLRGHAQQETNPYHRKCTHLHASLAVFGKATRYHSVRWCSFSLPL